MAEGVYTVVLRTTSYLVTSADANTIRAAQHARHRTVSFDAIRCCGNCSEGTMRVEEDLADIRALIEHEVRSMAAPAEERNVIPLFR